MSAAGFNPSSFSINSFSPLSFGFPSTAPSTPAGGIGNYRGRESLKLFDWGKICRFNTKQSKLIKRRKRIKTMKFTFGRKNKELVTNFITGFGSTGKSVVNVLSKREKKMSKRNKHKEKKRKKLHIRDRMLQNL